MAVINPFMTWLRSIVIGRQFLYHHKIFKNHTTILKFIFNDRLNHLW